MLSGGIDGDDRKAAVDSSTHLVPIDEMSRRQGRWEGVLLSCSNGLQELETST